MSEIKKFISLRPTNQDRKITLASGPVIIRGGKVLLDKHGSDTFWKFPGGTISDDESLQETAIREAKEELGVAIEISGDPILFSFQKSDEWIILFHYPARITSGEPNPGKDVREWAWHDTANLPEDIAPNVEAVMEKIM